MTWSHCSCVTVGKLSQCPVDLQGQNHKIASLWTMRWTTVCEGVSAIPRTQEWTWPHQVWMLGPCLLDHPLFWKAPLVSEHHLNTGLIDSHAKQLGPRLDIKWFTAEFLSCIIFYISLDCIRLLSALFFRLSPILCSQDTNFSLWKVTRCLPPRSIFFNIEPHENFEDWHFHNHLPDHGLSSHCSLSCLQPFVSISL